MRTKLKFSNGPSATEKFESVAHTCGKRWRCSGQQLILLMYQYFCPYTSRYKTVQSFMSANIGRLHLHSCIKRRTKCDIEDKIKDKQVAN
jgi:hypothetical protein